jgi:osomolarity two-component system sensor histidine kinase SLN1
LETAASLKAVELAISLDLMYTSCLYLTANGPVQQALKRYNNGSDTSLENWREAANDMAAALNSMGSLRHTPGVQSQLRARNVSGPAGYQSILNITGSGAADIELPWTEGIGRRAYLGEGSLGYPPPLYPNLTISEGDVSSGTYVAVYKEETLGLGSNLILGPLTINDNFSLMSMTVPVVDNYSATNILGWLTIVQSTRLIDTVVDDHTGLGQTGLTVLLGPTNSDNKFSIQTSMSGQDDVRFILPVRPTTTSNYASSSLNAKTFPASEYPAVESAISDGFHGRQELGSILSTYNEVGQKVSIAYATPPTTLVNWIVIVEQLTSEFWAPVDQLRTIILACLFSVLGFFFFASLPIAHLAVRPITRLRAATQSTIDPLYGSSSGSIARHAEDEEPSAGSAITRNNGLFRSFWWWRRNGRIPETVDRHEKRFRIPSKVNTKKFLKDDISDLMETFNEMSDELLLQYSKLEERVQQRTVELEQSKRAAESANESKTLFVANVSHELKTPLNGILGMCATSIEEDDVQQMKTSLSIIYKSGDLLLRTLNDLLMFSTNQVGSRELMLEEREFSLQDLESQILTIFEKQAVDKGISLRFECEEDYSNAGGSPVGLKSMTLWGDVHRILQIVINLVSNSMKYTPSNGSVIFAVRKSAEPAPRRLPRGLEQSSFNSQKTRSSLARRSVRGGTANFINPSEQYQLQERSVAPPGNDLYVEIEVRDTGQGIPDEMQSRIFEPFVQGEVGLNRRHSGTGLGLSICSQLAALMRGSIALKSALGVGSTFTVKIPLRQVIGTPSRLSTNPSMDVARSVLRLSLSTEAGKTDEKASEKEASDDPRLSQSRIHEIQFQPGDLENPLPQPENTEPFPERNKGGVPTASTQIPQSEDKASKDDANPVERPSTSQEQAAPPSTKAHKKARKTTKEDASAEQHDFSKLRVLVAEDNKVNQQVILRMLKMEQILQVTIAEDGQQALELVQAAGTPSAEAASHDLIFMDIQMPNMDGLTSTRLIREHGYQGPIVALTAFAEKSNVDDCFRSGMNHFLAKPLKKPQLREALIKLCSRSAESTTI